MAESEICLDDVRPKASQDNGERGSLPTREEWTRKREYILSLLGYTVGLGSLWRFPYLCNRHGGGAFLIPYFIGIITCSVPLFFLEITVSQFSSRSAGHVWVLCPLFKGIGISQVMAASFGSVLYNVIICWSIYYIYKSFSSVLPWTTCDNWWNTPLCVNKLGNVSSISVSHANSTHLDDERLIYSSWRKANVTLTASEEFWQYGTLRVSSGIDELGSVQGDLLLCNLVSWVVVFFCLMKGVKSVGKVVYVTALIPYILLTVLLIRSCMMPGAEEGIVYFLRPDFSRLASVQVWLEALLQGFYSTSVTYGGLITMSSYNNFNNRLLNNVIGKIQEKHAKYAVLAFEMSRLHLKYTIVRLPKVLGALGLEPPELVAQIRRVSGFSTGRTALLTLWVMQKDAVLGSLHILRNVLDVVIVTVIGEASSLFCGLVVFSTLGFMAHQAQIPISEVVSSGSGLGFIIYPEAIAQLPVPQLWAVLFFLMLFAMGIDSMFGLTETTVAGITDSWPQYLQGRRMWVTAGVCLACFVVSIPFVTEGGIYLFQLLDWYASSFSVLLIGCLECVVINWIYGSRRLSNDIEMMTGRRFPLLLRIMSTFLTPFILFASLTCSLFLYDPPRYGEYIYPESAKVIGIMVAVVLTLPIPVTLVYQVVKGRGSFLERLRFASRPSPEWGPLGANDMKLYTEGHLQRIPLQLGQKDRHYD